MSHEYRVHLGKMESSGAGQWRRLYSDANELNAPELCV